MSQEKFLNSLFLDSVADVINHFGWCQGNLRNTKDPQFPVGSVCVIGAAGYLLGLHIDGDDNDETYRAVGQNPAMKAFAEYLIRSTEDIGYLNPESIPDITLFRWNDRFNSGEPVINELRNVAKLWREESNDDENL